MGSAIVFGGSGFIGGHLVSRLHEIGIDNITIADIRKPQIDHPSNIEYRHCDVRQPIHLGNVDPKTIVINLAAISREPGFSREEYFETNVTGARNVVAFCRKYQIIELWFTSSMSVYGPCENPCTEASALEPITPYGESKKLAEGHYLEWAKEADNRRLYISRPAVIFGSGDHGNFTRLAKALKRGYFIFPGRRDTIKACGYVHDLIDSMFFVRGQVDKVITYNFAYPREYTIEEICRAFSNIAGYPMPKFTIPYPLVMSTAKLLQLMQPLGLGNEFHPLRIFKLVHSTNIYPAYLSSIGFHFSTDLESALKQWYLNKPNGVFL